MKIHPHLLKLLTGMKEFNENNVQAVAHTVYLLINIGNFRYHKTRILETKIGSSPIENFAIIMRNMPPHALFKYMKLYDPELYDNFITERNTDECLKFLLNGHLTSIQNFYLTLYNKFACTKPTMLQIVELSSHIL